jgi:hypothetical protein
MVGVHFTNLLALNIEGLYSLYNQKMRSGIDSLPWNQRTSLAYLEFPVLLHFDFENFKYLELGVKFGMLQSATGSYSNIKDPMISYTGANVKNTYAPGNTALVVGWGGGIWGDGGLLISGGFRLSYGLSDILSDAGGKGQNYISSRAKSEPYAPTNILTLGVHFTADFDLGWWVKRRNHKFVIFSH